MLPVKLLEPFAIGALVAPSRVIFGPHETNLGLRRSISQRHVTYYRRRAAGGAGVIITEEASVHESDWPYERAPLAVDCAEGWSAVADACHGEGSLVLAGLGHAGGQGTSHWSQRELWAPSRVPEVNTREVPKWMEPEDIDAVVSGFGAAARIAVRAGCDGVEINAGQYSLVRQFLSGLTNQRGDEWGEDRTKFLMDILAAVRGEIGGGRILALRLSCDELAPWAGITPDQAPELAALIVDRAASGPAGGLDMLTVVRGSIYSTSATRPDGHTPPGFNIALARSVAASVAETTVAASAAAAPVAASVAAAPVGAAADGGDRPEAGAGVRIVVQGSIVDVEMAESALIGEAGATGVIDGVEMTRALISDADLVAKVRAGEASRVRPCSLTNQRSQVRDNRNPIVTSSGDPFSGHETEDQPVGGQAAIPVALTIVGAGPAGLEAARVAASRGHEVTLIEGSERTGGMARVAANVPGFQRLALLADWLEAECKILGVEILTGQRVSAAELLAGSRGHIIVATGGGNGRQGYSATRAADVRWAADVLEDSGSLPDGRVLIWDPIGGSIGVGVAELLAAQGRAVHLATQDNIVGNELARSGDLAPANARLQQAGVELHRRVILRAVKKGSAVLEGRFNGETMSLKAAVVIDAGHRLPDESLWQELQGMPDVDVVRIGDCVAPRTIHDAILEGRRAALALG
ncbi:MAG: FAD-dependent oxidoreductase [Microthrixaceae bacterium]